MIVNLLVAKKVLHPDRQFCDWVMAQFRIDQEWQEVWCDEVADHRLEQITYEVALEMITMEPSELVKEFLVELGRRRGLHQPYVPATNSVLQQLDMFEEEEAHLFVQS